MTSHPPASSSERPDARSRRGDAADTPDDPRDGRHAKEISALEWIVAAIGLALVVAVVGYLVREATRDERTPPLLTVRMDSVTVISDSAWLVHFTADNRGRRTAGDVSVVGELGSGTAAEASRARIDYVPGRSQRRGGLIFRTDPRRAGIRLRVEGYQEP